MCFLQFRDIYRHLYFSTLTLLSCIKYWKIIVKSLLLLSSFNFHDSAFCMIVSLLGSWSRCVLSLITLAQCLRYFVQNCFFDQICFIWSSGIICDGQLCSGCIGQSFWFVILTNFFLLWQPIESCYIARPLLGGVSRVTPEHIMGNSEEGKGTKLEKSTPPAVVSIYSRVTVIAAARRVMLL